MKQKGHKDKCEKKLYEKKSSRRVIHVQYFEVDESWKEENDTDESKTVEK